MMNNHGSEAQKSPPWGPTIKLVVALTFVAILAAFLVRFRNLIAPFLLIFIISYLLHPLITRLENSTRLSWKASTAIVFLVVFILFLAGTAGTGVVIISQFQSLLRFIQTTLIDFPETAQELLTQNYEIGPFAFSFSEFFNTENIVSFVQQLLDYTQPVLSRAGNVLSAIATGTFTTLAWLFVILISSFFILSDMGNRPDFIDQLNLPDYNRDIQRLGLELSRIWNAFIRGQTILIILTFLLYSAMLGILGLRYAIAIAVLAGFSRLIPYFGQWITWIVVVLVSLLQRENYFGLESWQFMILVLSVGFIIDTMFDNIISPRVLGESLGVNPALVLIAALVAANLIGIIGVFLAAPVLVSLRLFGQYAMRKMLDQDPFPSDETDIEPVKYPWVTLQENTWPWLKPRLLKILAWVKNLVLRLGRNIKSVFSKEKE